MPARKRRVIAIRSRGHMLCRMLVLARSIDGPIASHSISNCDTSIRRKLRTPRPWSSRCNSPIGVSYVPYSERRRSHGLHHVRRRRRALPLPFVWHNLSATTARARTTSSSESIAAASVTIATLILYHSNAIIYDKSSHPVKSSAPMMRATMLRAQHVARNNVAPCKGTFINIEGCACNSIVTETLLSRLTTARCRVISY